MSDAVLLLGGRSEIGLAVVEELLRSTPAHVVLAERPGHAPDPDREASLRRAGATGVEVVAFDAEALETHEAVVADVFARHRVTHAVVAFGVLGDQERAWTDIAAAQRIMTVDATAAAGVGVALVQAFDAQRGDRGTIVAISSMAGVRVRRSNFVYGAAKSAMDAVYLNLAVAAGERGPRIVVVRPGAVATRMIAGNDNVALTTTPQEVARRVAECLRGDGRPGSADVVHVPRAFAVAAVLSPLVPRRIWHRLRN